MKIAVVNGSPKGKDSITLQTVNYWKILYPEQKFSVIDAGRKIRSFENDMSEAARILNAADLILFCYPVYTFLVPAQLHRFIELIKENGIDLSGKYATQLSTSKHFYDVTAHRFIEDNCRDLGMKVIRGLSADMDDLTLKKGRKEARDFFKHLMWTIEQDLQTSAGDTSDGSASSGLTPSDEKKPGVISVVADLAEDDAVLQSMVDEFIGSCGHETRLVNLRDFKFGGGCISCFNCASDGTCIYKDGFDRLLREEIQTADAIVLAFTIRDHSMGHLFKLYDDRQFCNGHRTVTMGKPFGYLVNGALSKEENLRMVIEARADTGGNYLAGVACSENDPHAETASLISELDYCIEHDYNQPKRFYGVGGMKIFRDLIWLMQGLMKADHRFYKAHGQYDFPQKKRPTMWAMYLVGAMMSNKKLKAKMGGKMSEGMLMPYTKALKNAKNEAE